MVKTGFLVLAVLGLGLAWAGPARADFGPMGVDGRVLGRGGTAAADAEGPGAVYWNPAGLTRFTGLLASLDYGMLQRPDFGSREFGATDRLLLGFSFGSGKKGAPGSFGFGAALEKPFPRFDYAGSRRIVSGNMGTPRVLSVTASQDYMELLAGAGLRVFGGELLGGKSALRVGMNLGLGFSSNAVQGSLTSLAGPTVHETLDEAGMSLMLPGGLGLQFDLAFKAVTCRLGIRYRGVMPLSDPAWLSFPQGKLDLNEADLFMPPPQEGAVALSFDFFRRLRYSLELGWYFFDSPDKFPNFVPHSYPVLKLGFEYRIPLKGEGNSLTTRFGLSNSFIDDDALESVYSNPAAGVYFGWGLNLGPLTRFDVYFTLQVPGEGDVDDDTFLAGVSYSVRF
jgi:hypothetical protein